LLVYLRFNEDKRKAKKRIENSHLERERELDDEDDKVINKDQREDSLEKIMEENYEDNEDEDAQVKEKRDSFRQFEKILFQNVFKKNNANEKPKKSNSSSSESEDNRNSKKKNSEIKQIKVLQEVNTNKNNKSDKGNLKSKIFDNNKKTLTLMNNKPKPIQVTVTDEVKDVEKNTEEQKNVERLKGEINKKFKKKINKLIEFLSKTKIQFDSKANPIVLLDKLKKETEIIEKNEIIDQIESIITNLFKNERKNNI